MVTDWDKGVSGKKSISQTQTTKLGRESSDLLGPITVDFRKTLLIQNYRENFFLIHYILGILILIFSLSSFFGVWRLSFCLCFSLCFHSFSISILSLFSFLFSFVFFLLSFVCSFCVFYLILLVFFYFLILYITHFSSSPFIVQILKLFFSDSPVPHALSLHYYKH